jgi:type I restriction enzyme R subunit
MTPFDEDTLVQQTTSSFLEQTLGWESIYAYNNEDFGPNSLLGRKDQKEVVLTRYLCEALKNLNPGLPNEAYQNAMREIIETPFTQTPIHANRDKYFLLRDGVKVQFRNSKGEQEKKTLRVFDFDQPAKNHFVAVRELWIKGSIYRRRPDLIAFVNGIPLVIMEFKNVNRSIQSAYDENISDYRDTIPHIFNHNAFVVLGNGAEGKLGAFSSKYDYFKEWKRLKESDVGVVDMETLLLGVMSKNNLLDLFENFILFDHSRKDLTKIVGRNHQLLGVNQAIDSVLNRNKNQGKLGVFWHTQGSGKSYSMVFFTQKIRRKISSKFSFLICTDRDDLDTQIYKTFIGSGLVNEKDECRASSGEHLKKLLSEKDKSFVFTLIQKFNEDVDPQNPYTLREDVIVISDEAHRTQYGRMALNMRNALPKASYIGFTGTPLFSNDEITRKVFGNYVSTYDFQRAVEDEATVPLYYEARGEKLGVVREDLNEKLAAKLEELEIEDIDTQLKLERELHKEYHLITANSRLEQIAKDFVDHYSTTWESGKAMFVCIDKVTCVRMFNLVQDYWKRKLKEVQATNNNAKSDWMSQTLMAVVVSEEQGEVAKFKQWDLDIQPHRKLMKEGFGKQKDTRKDLESAFKDENHPFRVAFVCAMWLTGFDVPSLATLYLDKPLKAHTLMQAIARANRVYENKPNGLIVDYCGILKNLRKALATFAGHQGEGLIDDSKSQPEIDPVKPEEELIKELAVTIDEVTQFLKDKGFLLERILSEDGFNRNRAIVDAKEAINENDNSRKRFEVLAREVFKRFKSCLTIKGINNHRKAYDVINIIYKSLQDDREQADITHIIRQLHEIIDEGIVVGPAKVVKNHENYDISKIDFVRLKKEFEKSKAKNTLVQGLKEAVENKLNKMIQANPMRSDFQKRYEELIEAYNSEKDRATIERTFEELIKLVDGLNQEEQRAVREGFQDDEQLAIFDLLLKPELEKKDIPRIKKVAVELLSAIRNRIETFDNWREKESTRDQIKVEIKNLLWDEKKGLPASYTPEEIEQKTEQIYVHMYEIYKAA